MSLDNITTDLYDSIAELYGDDPIPFEEHVRNAGRPTSRDPKDVLLRVAGIGQRRLLRKYLSECFKMGFRHGEALDIAEPNSSVPMVAELHGFIENAFVDIALISKTEFTMFRPPDWAIIACAAKATWAERKEAILVGMNRDNQEWAFWHLSGDLSAVAYAVESNFESPPAKIPAAVIVKPFMQMASKVDEYLLALNSRPSGRSQGVFHPSEFSITECDRWLAYELNGIKKHEDISPQLRRIFDVGHSFHDVAQHALGHKFPEFRAEVPIKNASLRFSGSCDGTLHKEGAELKTISSKGAEKLRGPKTDHKKQATIYGANLDLDVMHYVYAVKETGELIHYPVPVDRKLWHQIATRAANILNAVDQKLLPPQIDKDYLCKKCPFAWTCKPGLAASTYHTHDTLRTFR